MIPRHVQSIFCDDIREEINGKISYIGVYSGTLLVREFPVTLPKLCVSLNLVTPADKPLKTCTIHVYKDDEVLQEITFDEEELRNASESIENFANKSKFPTVQVFKYFIIFSPIQFTGPCLLRIQIQTEDEELRAMGLKIAQLQDD